MNQIARVPDKPERPNLPAVLDHEALAKSAMLLALQAVKGPPLIPYDAFRRFLDDNDLRYFMLLDSKHRYIKSSIPTETLELAMRSLWPPNSPDDFARHQRALGTLYTLTIKPKRDDNERSHLLNSYLSKCRHYPPVIVEYVLDAMSGSCKFFPPWSEINEQIAALSGWRGHASHRLAQMISERRSQKD